MRGETPREGRGLLGKMLGKHRPYYVITDGGAGRARTEISTVTFKINLITIGRIYNSFIHLSINSLMKRL